MLNYEWENPNPNPSSSIMFNGNGGAGGGLEELISQSIQPNRISDHHHHQQQQHSHSFNDATIVTPPIINPHDFFLQQYHYRMLNNPNFHDCVIYPPSPSSSSSPVQLSLEIDQSGTFVLMPKLEVVVPYGCNIDFSNSLNLYFSPEEDDYTVNNHRGRRSRSMEVGVMMHSPKCQIEGCNADLSHARHYHRRHKVCEFHSKAATVVTGGLAQRYCQQCSRFHILSEFDEGKRSCRKRLADHNRRRRKLSHNEASNPVNDQP
ncbi:hypothetical protein LXL04_026898 [Taraxacum kok-saghyz]